MARAKKPKKPKKPKKVHSHKAAHHLPKRGAVGRSKVLKRRVGSRTNPLG